MRLITYHEKGSRKEQVGIVSEEGRVAPLSAFGFQTKTMNDLIAHTSEEEFAMLDMAAKSANRFMVKLDDITVLAPIPEPLQDIICLGLNYTEHASEAAGYSRKAFTRDKYPVYFSKRASYCPGDGAGIPSYEGLVDSLDYEAELGVIIGRDAKNVKAEDALDYIFGYTICNDVSARNLQTRHTQWYFGKSLDGFAPMGPCIVTKDEISWPPKLPIRSYVNGELRQNANTGMMIWGIDEVIEELSFGMTLKAGTIISTGTPKGVGMGFKPPKFLKKKDTVTCEIEGIGTLTNTIV